MSKQVGQELRLSPDGHLYLDGKDNLSAGDLAAHFGDGDGRGLVLLGASSANPKEGIEVAFWRSLGSDLLRALCHLPESTPPSAGDLAPPDEETLAGRVANAPPMPGGEYLTPTTIAGIWSRSAQWLEQTCADLGGIGAFLEKHAPSWSRVGRVTLHLAENKGDKECPFAFMATYASEVKRGKVRRLPLGQALTEYAGEGRKDDLIRLLQPVEKAARASELIGDLVETGDVFHPLAWTPQEAHVFLKEVPLYEEAGLVVLLPNWWRRRTRPRVQVSIDSKKGVKINQDALLKFDLGLALGGERLSDAEIEDLMQAEGGLSRIRGEWVEVDQSKLREALDHWEKVRGEVEAGALGFVEAMRLLAGAPADLGVGDEEQDAVSWALVNASGQLAETLAKLRDPSSLVDAQPAGLAGTLRDYQLAGLNWLSLCGGLGLGACLADDMGLGKTIQVLAALLRWKDQQGKSASGTALLVVPASLLGNWGAEAARFAPDLRLRVLHGSETSRQDLAAIGDDPEGALFDVDLALTTYGMAARLDWIADHDWDWLVLDEAQAIKNPNTRQTKAIKAIPAQRRVALTGTPVENRIGDLWSIFDFLNPGLLGSAPVFRRFVKSLAGDGGARYAPLRKLVAPYILRRMKTDPDIVPDLPDKTEMQVYCGLGKLQATLYKKGVEAMKEALDEAAGGEPIQRRGLVLSYLMRFKQICNHPAHFSGDGDYDPKKSAKFIRLGELAEEIASRGEKMLVFTQFREIVDPLSAHLGECFGRGGLELHGGTPVARRKDLVAEFQQPGGPPFMVLSLKAGGTGLNLVAASHVVHFDRWWNPAIENQATDRAFRIGQKRNVLVHKFVVRGTIEEKIDAMIREKQEVADAILQEGSEGGGALTEMSDEQIIDMVTLDIERAGA